MAGVNTKIPEEGSAQAAALGKIYFLLRKQGRCCCGNRGFLIKSEDEKR